MEDIILGKTRVKPGENKRANIHVASLPSGHSIDISAHVFRSTVPGPQILVLGGVHGDEINGIETVRRTLHNQLFTNIKKGTVIVIPILNVYGFINFSREVPDGKDVNRSFPGTMAGSLAGRVARTLTKYILPHTDLILDFHTGGASRYNYPQIRFNKTDTRARSLAKIFGSPFVIEKPLIVKSLRKIAKELNISTLVYEGGESVRLDGFAIEKAYRGVVNILQHFEMIDGQPQVGKEQILIKSTSWIRAPYAGIFVWSQRSGRYVKKGEILGHVHDPQGKVSNKVIAKKSGYIIGHNNASVVNHGDALFHIGVDFEKL